MRLQDRPTFRASASVDLRRLPRRRARGARDRQAGLYPSNCRLLDAGEALTAGAGSGSEAVLLARLRVGRPCARRLDGARPRVLRATTAARCPTAPARRGTRPTARARAPPAPGGRRSSARPTCATRWSGMGMISETFETAITWDRFEAFHAAVMGASRGRGAARLRRGDGDLPLHPRLSGRSGALLHRHRAEPRREPARAVGRDQGGRVARRSSRTAARSPTTTPSAATTAPGTTASARTASPPALRAAKRALDPAGILNPGVLIDP